MIDKLQDNLTLEEKKILGGIFSEKYYKVAYFSGIAYASSLLLELFEKIGILELLKNNYPSSKEIIEKFDFILGAKYSLEWMLNFLSQAGLLEKTEANKYHYNKTENINPQKLLEEVTKIDKNIVFSTNLMNYVISEYPNFFSGRKKGFEIIFAADKMSLWNDYFNNENSGYSAYNSLGAFGVAKWVAGCNNLKLLELGGGTGGATSALMDRLIKENKSSPISEYIFSDVSPIFLRIGNRTIMSKNCDCFPYLLKRLDFDKPLVEQEIAENSIDIVYAVNALHAARNLVDSLKNIHKVIKRGGKIIFCEYCRPNINHLLLQEFIFCLLDNYMNVDLDCRLRPVPGFLDFPHWELNLEAAGFKNIEAIFNTDADSSLDPKIKVGIIAAVIKGEKI